MQTGVVTMTLISDNLKASQFPPLIRRRISSSELEPIGDSLHAQRLRLGPVLWQRHVCNPRYWASSNNKDRETCAAVLIRGRPFWVRGLFSSDVAAVRTVYPEDNSQRALSRETQLSTRRQPLLRASRKWQEENSIKNKDRKTCTAVNLGTWLRVVVSFPVINIESLGLVLTLCFQAPGVDVTNRTRTCKTLTR